MVGNHRMWIKGWIPDEETYRVPLIVRWPSHIRPGSKTDRLVQTHDLAHTYVEAASAAPLPFRDGRALQPLFDDSAARSWPDQILCAYYGGEFLYTQRIGVTRRLKYVFNGFDVDEMYDLVRDPRLPAVLAVPFSWRAVAVCAASYLVRMFGITAGFHRPLAHRSYSADRVFQFVIAWLGTSSLQRGPLWWAGHHRYHHRYADTEEDVHSPVSRSFWWAHMGWVLSRQWNATDRPLVRDLSEFRELIWLDRWFLRRRGDTAGLQLTSCRQ
jgi:hypothetical protein